MSTIFFLVIGKKTVMVAYLDFRVHVTQSIVYINFKFSKQISVFSEHILTIGISLVLVSHFSLNILLKLADISTFKPAETSHLLIRSSEKMSGQNFFLDKSRKSIGKYHLRSFIFQPHSFFIDERLPPTLSQIQNSIFTSPPINFTLCEFKTPPFIYSKPPLYELKIPLYPSMDSILSLHNF